VDAEGAVTGPGRTAASDGLSTVRDPMGAQFFERAADRAGIAFPIVWALARVINAVLFY